MNSSTSDSIKIKRSEIKALTGFKTWSGLVFRSGNQNYDIHGKLCFQKIISRNGERVITEVALSGFRKGIYSVIATDGTKQEVRNFVKE